jgi:hypothetical protein
MDYNILNASGSIVGKVSPPDDIYSAYGDFRGSVDSDGTIHEGYGFGFRGFRRGEVDRSGTIYTGGGIGEGSRTRIGEVSYSGIIRNASGTVVGRCSESGVPVMLVGAAAVLLKLLP